MPRIPQSPHCDCHIPTGASEDIKLKVMEEKLKAAIPGIKEIKYISTEGLTKKYEIVYTNDQASNYLYIDDGKPLNVLQYKSQCEKIGDAYMADGTTVAPGTYGHLWILDDPSKKEQYPVGWHKGPYVKGDSGENGIGIDSITKTGTLGLVDEYTITYTSVSKEETKFYVTNGKDGLGVLENSLTATVSVGGISAGESFVAGTSVEEILRKMLVVQKVLQHIYIAVQPVKLSYIAGERFDTAGMVVKAHYNVGEDEVISNYSYSPSGPLTINDNKVTVSYGGKSVDQAITVLAPVTDIDIYYGATTAVPTSLDGLTKKTVAKTILLSTNGYLQNIKSGDIITGNSQHPVIAVPKTLSVYDCKVGGIQVITDFSSCESGDFKIYYQNTPTYDEDLGGTDFTFYIKEN